MLNKDYAQQNKKLRIPPISRILENPFIWNLFRKLVDVTIGWDSKKRLYIQTIGNGAINNPEYNVLDLGCGIGNSSQIFDSCKGYVGIDLNSQYIDYANKKFGNDRVSFICADAVEYSYKMQGRFDLVTAFDFLHHIPDNLCLTLLESANRLSKRYVFINEPIRAKNQPLIYRFLIRFDRGKYIRTSEALRALIDKSGLKIIDNPNGNIILCTTTKNRE